MEEITHFVLESHFKDLPQMIEVGWGNGYVLIPEGHPLHGKHYDEIDVDIHGGLTFSNLVDDQMAEYWGLEGHIGKWCIGFDTCHLGDTLDRWPKYKVEDEAIRLKEQIQNYKQ